MGDRPQFVYDEDERTVLLKADENSAPVYSDVSPEEFEKIEDIDRFITEASSLLDEMLHITVYQRRMVGQGTYFEQLNELQQAAAEYYQQCVEYQDILSNEESDVLKAQLPPIYKLEKFLKHFFRSLTICQSLAFSQRLGVHYVQTEDYLYLYGFVRNVCSTVEYLGTLMESRLGEGNLHLNDNDINAVDAYEEVKRQGLDDVFNPDEEIHIPLANEAMKQEDLGLSTDSMEYLWDKRCDIVHDCPLVVNEETIEHLPEEIISTKVITASDEEKLTRLSFRLHFQSVSLFINFAISYLKKLIVATTKALYLEE